MEIRIADFNELTKHYKTYVDGFMKILHERELFIKKIKPYNDEIKNIINSYKSNIILNQASQEKNQQRFEELSKYLTEESDNYNAEVKKKEGDLNVKVYDEMKIIINEYAINKNIDLVISESDVIYNTKQIDITEDIISLFKEKKLYIDVDLKAEKEKLFKDEKDDEFKI